MYHREKAKVQSYPLQMTEIPEWPFNKIAIDLVKDYEISSSATRISSPSLITLQDGWKLFHYQTHQQTP